MYLPMISTAQSTQQNEPKSGKQALFQEPNKKTGTPDVAIDAQGGTHMVYAYHVPVADNPDLVYAYCPAPASACSDASRWRRINLGGPVDHAQIELTPAGTPRIVARGDSQEKSGFKNYYYGECNNDCLADSGWNFAAVTDSYTNGTSDITGYYLPKRYFALDPQGKPRFVFYNGDYKAEPDRYGGYYASCDTSCANGENWSVTLFTHAQPEKYRYELLDNPALTFTSKGEPRVVGNVYLLDNNDTTNGIYYFGCNSGCDDDANWARIKIAERGGGGYPAWDIALDSADRPRIAFYKEDVTEGDSGKRLHITTGVGTVPAPVWHTERTVLFWEDTIRRFAVSSWCLDGMLRSGMPLLSVSAQLKHHAISVLEICHFHLPATDSAYIQAWVGIKRLRDALMPLIV